MRLELKNVGVIENAEIDIDAITVIAGRNSTGKSTVGKMLFCIFNSLYMVEEQIAIERISSIEKIFHSAYQSITNKPIRFINAEDAIKILIANKSAPANTINSIKGLLIKTLVQYDPTFQATADKEKLDGAANSIKHILDITDHELLTAILQKRMSAEFNMQINNFHHPDKESEITLEIKGTAVQIIVRENDNVDITNGLSLNTEAIYIDDPYAIDSPRLPASLSPKGFNTHRDHLRINLAKESTPSIKETLEEIVAAKRLSRVFERLNTVCPGEIVNNTGRSFSYEDRKANALIDTVNVSTGLKTFVIIKKLLLNGCLEMNGTIILDEPEIHLHPEWQLVFAELIVLLQIEFNMHILINTHSPYFLDALEVYSQKHGNAEKCRYYISEIADSTAEIYDVTGDTEQIYEKLGRPFQDLENERYAGE